MFITIDGPDGTGKTTLAKTLSKRLNDLNISATYTSEPTDSPLGSRIRQVLKNGGEELNMLTELFVQDRKEHIEAFIIPLVLAGNTVICDRYKYSTVCYQHLQGEPIDKLIKLNSAFVSPDIAFILNVKSPDILLRRIEKRGLAKDLFEKRSILSNTIKMYNKMSTFYPNDNIVYIDASSSLDKILSEILLHVLKLYQGKKKPTIHSNFCQNYKLQLAY